MIRKRRGVALAALLAALLAMLPPAARGQAETAAFEAAPCMFEVPQLLQEGRDLECGYLTVPERHAVPDGPTIRLAVAIVKSTGANPAPDPLVLLQGGPGGSTIDTYSQVLSIGRLSRLRRERDLILFDQRGTLYSEPALTCPEQWQLTEETIEQHISRDEYYERSLAADLACRARLAGEGVRLDAFDSLENAADVEALRVALGYDKINLYGISYGTLLALHVIREHPAGLRSVILDAVLPTHMNFIPEVPRSQDRAFGELFAACAADTACADAYPNLEQSFFELVARLNAAPARVPLTDPETKKTYSAVFDGDAIQGVIFQMLYVTEVIPALPLVIAQMSAGDFSFISRIYPQIAFDRTLSAGMYYSVICAEDADFTPQDVDTRGIRPQIAEHAAQDAAYVLQVCRQWDVEPLPPEVDAPVASDIPTLVLNGRFDPITPPAFGEAAAATLGRSYIYTFGFSGHGAATSGACAEGIIAAFLADPASAPDASCIAERPAPEFLTARNVALTEATGRLLDRLQNEDLLPLALMALSLLALLTLFLVWPLQFLIRIFRGKPVAPAPGATLARLAAALAALLGLVFVVGMFAAIVQTASVNEIVLFFGLPTWAGWLLALPWAVGALALVMLLSAAAAWVRRAWSVWGRLYYSLLALAALGFTLALAPFVVGG